ncbi:MAG: hypothetical protein ACYTBV_19000, partial [Planctomycetota bacterium]
IGVRPGILEDPNAYTFMEPLQKVMPTPYALYSVKAGFSEDSNSLDGLDSSDFASSFHLHSGEDIATGTVAEARIDAAIARDTEILPEVLANDGSGSGLDADLLDGMDSSAFSTSVHTHDAAAIVSGILNVGRYSSFSDLGNEGYLGDSVGDIAQNNGVLQPTLNADLLDGMDSSAFSTSVHTHDAAAIVSGILNVGRYSAFSDLGSEGYLGNAPGDIAQNNGALQPTLNADRLDGLNESSFFRLNQGETVSGRPYFYGGTTGSTPPFYVDSTYRVSGLNADYLDGYHYSSFVLTNQDFGRSGVSGTLYEGTTPIANKYVNVTGDSMTGTLAISKSIAGLSYGIDVASTSSGSSAYGGNFSAYCQSASTGSVVGTRNYGYHYGTSGTTYGTYSYCYGSNTGDSYGIHSTAYKHSSDTSGYAYGGYFTGDNDITGGESYGVYARATGANGYRYGVYSDISASGYTNYGFYADITNSNGSAYGGSFRPDLTGGTGGLYGLYCSGSHGGTSGYTYGLYTSMYGSDTGNCYGVHGNARKSSSDTGGTSYGGYFYSYNDRTGGDTYGVYTSTDGLYGRNYGVYSEADAYDGYGGYGFYTDIDGYSDGASPYGFYADLDSSNSYYSFGLLIDSDKTSTTATGGMSGAYINVNHAGTSGTVYGVEIYGYPSNTGSVYGLYSYAGSTTTGSRYAGYFVGNVHVSGTLTATSKPFVQPHKTDPTKEIVYISVESREHVVVIRGKATLTNGVAVIEMPGDWIQVAAG